MRLLLPVVHAALRAQPRGFKAWLKVNYSPKVARDAFNYAMKYANCLFNGNLTALLMLNGNKRNHVMRALAALSKFLGVHKEFKALVKKYGLSWSKGKKDEMIINRLIMMK